MERELTSDRDIIAEQLRGADREIGRLTKLLTTLADKDLESEELLSLLVSAEARRTLLQGQRDAITSDLRKRPGSPLCRGGDVADSVHHGMMDTIGMR